MKKLLIDNTKSSMKSMNPLKKSFIPSTTKAKSSFNYNESSQKSTFYVPQLKNPSSVGRLTHHNIPSQSKTCTSSRGKSFDLQLSNLNSEKRNGSVERQFPRESKSQQHKDHSSSSKSSTTKNYAPVVKGGMMSTTHHTISSKQLAHCLENLQQHSPLQIIKENNESVQLLKDSIQDFTVPIESNSAYEIPESLQPRRHSEQRRFFSRSGIESSGKSCVKSPNEGESSKYEIKETPQEFSLAGDHLGQSPSISSLENVLSESSECDSKNRILEFQSERSDYLSQKVLSNGIYAKERKASIAQVEELKSTLSKVLTANNPTASSSFQSKLPIKSRKESRHDLYLNSTSSRMATEENQTQTQRGAKTTKVVNSQPSENIGMEKYKGRAEELNSFVQKINQNLKKVPYYENHLVREKNQLQTNLKLINEEIQKFTSSIIELLQSKTEEMITTLNVEFGREMIRLTNFSENLKNMNKGLQDILADIESNYQRILYKINEQPYRMIMDKYVERLPVFENFFGNSKNFDIDYTKFLPTEKIAHIKRNLRNVVNDSLAKSLTGNGMMMAKDAGQAQKVVLSSPPIHEIKSIGVFDNFLLSKESDDMFKFKTANNNCNNINIVSFENKDIFQNALKDSMEPMVTTNFTRESHINTLASNVFASEQEDFKNPSEALQTPKLNCEIQIDIHQAVSPFSDDPLSSYQAQDSCTLSSQVASSQSSLHALDINNLGGYFKNQHQPMFNKVLGARPLNLRIDENTNFLNYPQNRVIQTEKNYRIDMRRKPQSPAFKRDDDDEETIYE